MGAPNVQINESRCITLRVPLINKNHFQSALARMPQPCVPRPDLLLSSHLGRLGAAVATSPAYFLVVSLLTTALLGHALLDITVVSDIEHLFVPSNALSKQHRAAIQQFFPDDYTR